MALVEKVNHGKRVIPTIIFPDGSILIEPSNAQLADKFGLRTKARCTFYDSIVIGGGRGRGGGAHGPAGSEGNRLAHGIGMN